MYIPQCCSKQRFLKSLVQNMIIWCFLALPNKATLAGPFPESFNSLFYSVLWQFRPFNFTCCGPSLFPASNSMLAPYPRILDRVSNLISRKVPLYALSSLHNFIFSSLSIQPYMYSLNFCQLLLPGSCSCLQEHIIPYLLSKAKDTSSQVLLRLNFWVARGEV